MWVAIFGGIAVMGVISALYLFARVRKFEYVKRLAKGSKIKEIIIADGSVIGLGLVLWLTLNAMNAVICFLHLLIFWLICDAAGFCINKIRKAKPKRYIAGIVAICVTAVYMSAGWYFAHHVFQTDYTLTTDKPIGSLRIVQISDVHIGNTMDADGFGEYIEQINALKPDVLVITGDFVDDYTSREQMISACEKLSTAQTKYGVYFVLGNHDKGYFSEGKRGWSFFELMGELANNGVCFLRDKAVTIDDRFCLICRKDVSEGNRMEISKLTEGVDEDIYTIVLDHQPHDYDAQTQAGVDLVLSGHTHGGQLLPVIHAGEWFGVNCRTYGYEKRDNTEFIVSSGIGCWAMGFKTGCISEYVVIDIEQS